MIKLTRKFLIQLWSVGIGALYGLACRLIFSLKEFHTVLGIMTIAFIFLVPFAVGYFVVYYEAGTAKLRLWKALLAPWMTVLVMTAAMLLFAWEGIICVMMWLPISLLMSSLGGICGSATRSWEQSKAQASALTICLLLPFILAPLENQFELPQALRTVKTQITIHASAETIWRNIERVPIITTEEHESSWAQRIGFPKPISATLSHEGVGAVRHATFEGNVLFIETITQWEPPRKLAFAIRADTKNIPAVTLDEHVTIGGPFFDVLEGEYEIEMVDDTTATLHLSSKHRLSTRFNFYAQWWSDFIMADIQNNILKIIKKRCER